MLGMTPTNQNLIQEEIKRRLLSGNACYKSIVFAFSKYLVQSSTQRECDGQGTHVACMGAKELETTSLYFPDNRHSLRGLGDGVVGVEGKLNTSTIVI
jgi:hypothetical protein